MLVVIFQSLLRSIWRCSDESSSSKRVNHNNNNKEEEEGKHNIISYFCWLSYKLSIPPPFWLFSFVYPLILF